jgi:protein-S-isoprenylcysteine O-methyltransferase Ste14
MVRWQAVYVLAAAYVLVGVVLWKRVPLDIAPAGRGLLVLAGAVFYFPGVFLYLWGFNTLGAMFGVSSAFASELYEAHALVVRGPYRIIRHPMYLGVLMAAVGALLIFQTWAMVLYAPSAFGVIIRARREERLLAEAFGEEWVEYVRHVPGWLPKINPLSAWRS